MTYLHKIDDKIVDALYCKKIKEERKIHFNAILEIVKKSLPSMTRRVLSRHLNLMEEHGIIHRDTFKPGVERYNWLAKRVKWALDLEMPVPRVKSKREEIDNNNNNRSRGKQSLYDLKKQKNKKVYLLLMSLVTIGFSVPEPVRSEIRPWDIFIENKPYRSSITLPGVSISNFFHEYRDSANGWRFRYVKFKNASEVRWYFDKLNEYELPLIKPISEIEWIKREQLQKGLSWPVEGETRYGIVDKQLHEFLLDCIILLGETESLMKHIWKYKRRPRREEVEWYEFLYGRRYTSSFFIQINPKRSDLKKATKQRKKAEAAARADYKAAVETGDFRSPKYKTACEILDYITAEETINRIKAAPYNHYQMLFEEKYNNVRANYGVITDSLIQIAYPHFKKLYKIQSAV